NFEEPSNERPRHHPSSGRDTHLPLDKRAYISVVGGFGGTPRRGLFDLLDELFEVGDLLAEGGLPRGGESDPGARAFTLVALLDVHQLGLLENSQVLSEVSGGQM